MKKIVLFLSALLAFCATAVAEVTLPSLMGDGMVLQRNSQVNLWGSATGSTVKVETSWDGRKYSVKPDSDGSWRVQVSTPDAGGPYRITFNDGQKIVLDNVLIGEVWICSGQSNMEMPVGGWDHQRVNGSAETIRAATSTPLVRMFTVKRHNADEPQETCEGEWKTSTPAAVRYFSATAYYFGKTLSEYLPDVPIGLIATDWGGTPIEAWMSAGTLEATPGINLQLAKSHRWYEVRTGQLFNGMIYPLRKYKARGFIWYQGEANLNAAVDYPALTVSMVNEWRELWGDPDMPYYLVQIAPHAYGNPAADALPRFVEQQYRIPSMLPHSGIAPTTDIGHCDCIHPPFKQEVGERLAWLALARDYGISDLPVAPEYKGMKIESSAVRLSFKRGGGAGDGLMCFGPQRKLELKGFEVAGADRVWHDAVAEIERKSNDILVSSPEVPHPAAVRYAFRNWPEGANVTTDNGLPLPMFRTDLFNRADTLRLLAIGNSFSEDAVENNLWELLDAAGIPAVVANMFIGGCSLERHYGNSVSDAPAYRYRKVVDGKTVERNGVSLSEALADEKWTHVSFQQASGLSGRYESYDPYLASLIEYVKDFVGEGTCLAFHQTWAYAASSTHPDFPAYGRDQMQMYECICGAVSSALADHPEITLMVPSGTAIQNARASSLGDNLTRDGYHLERTYGRYTAACTWFAALTGLRAADSTWAPASVDPAVAKICRRAADQAVSSPYSPTRP